MGSGAAAGAGLAAPPRESRHRPTLVHLATGRVYWMTSVVVGLLMASQTLNRQWSADAAAHAAAITELARSPWAPQEPFVGGESPNPYLTPWSLVWGLLARAASADAGAVLVLAGLVNLVLLLLAFRLFTRELGFDDPTSALALVSALVLWGLSPWRWSGFISLNSLGFGLPYPSATGFALMLLAWTLLLRALRTDRWAGVVALVPLVAVLVLTHPFSAVNTAVGVAALLAARATSWRVVGVVAVAFAAGGLISLAWPFFSVLQLAAASGAYDAIHSTFFGSSALPRIALFLVALPALALRARQDRRDPLVLLTASATAVYVAAWALGAFSLGRVLPVVVLGPQLALAWALTSAPATRAWRWWRGAALLALAVGLLACLPGLSRAAPTLLLSERAETSLHFRPLFGPDVGADVAPGDTVLSFDNSVSRALVARGVRVVSPPYVQPLLPDLAERQRATGTFLTASREQRRATVTRYEVDWVLVPTASGPRLVRPWQVDDDT